ncbi:hypothetical protein ABW19_dt0201483 [Dactylella cylindrospora]|nr:hypothetical protein ABW19_dt0201483 [Dactylella cylindrospora]
MVQFTRSILFAALSVSGAFAQLKTLLDYPDGLSGPFNPGFLERTAAPLERIERWGEGWIPQGCKDRFLSKNLLASDAEVFNVKYSDCDRAWTFCRHNTAELSIEQMADSFGRMPVHMRSLVRHAIALPQNGCSAQAFTDRGDIVMFGPCTGVTVWLHETGHQLDSRLKPAERFSGTQEWLEALGADTCVPDSYANTNTVEDFAQVTVVSQYNTLLGFKPTEKYPGCLDHRHGLLEHNFRALYLEYGGSCSSRPADSEIVSTATTKREVMRLMRRANETDPASIGPCFFDEM